MNRRPLSIRRLQTAHSAATQTFDKSLAPDLSTFIMLNVLGLIAGVMIANLLIMVIIGGYEAFVSRLALDHHAGQPEWLRQVNVGVLKVKLATALISISSIHLLKTFIMAINPPAGVPLNHHGIMRQVI